MAYARGKIAFGFCDRCGQRYPLKRLYFEYTDGRRNGLRVCGECFDEDHPLNFQEDVIITEAIALYQPRPDTAQEASRGLWGWWPTVSSPKAVIKVGQVQVTTT